MSLLGRESVLARVASGEVKQVTQLLVDPARVRIWSGNARIQSRLSEDNCREALIDAAGPDAQYSFYRTAAGAEIDLVIERAGKIAFAIEIKRSAAPKVEQGFFWGANDIEAARKIVVTPNSERYPLRDGVEVMPLIIALDEVQAK
jgi:predicted AAA+ superfamily ATPase